MAFPCAHTWFTGKYYVFTLSGFFPEYILYSLYTGKAHLVLNKLCFFNKPKARTRKIFLE